MRRSEVPGSVEWPKRFECWRADDAISPLYGVRVVSPPASVAHFSGMGVLGARPPGSWARVMETVSGCVELLNSGGGRAPFGNSGETPQGVAVAASIGFRDAEH